MVATVRPFGFVRATLCEVKLKGLGQSQNFFFYWRRVADDLTHLATWVAKCSKKSYETHVRYTFNNHMVFIAKSIKNHENGCTFKFVAH